MDHVSYRFSVIGGQQEQLVYLSSLAEVIGTHNQSWIDIPTLEQVRRGRVFFLNVLYAAYAVLAPLAILIIEWVPAKA